MTIKTMCINWVKKRDTITCSRLSPLAFQRSLNETLMLLRNLMESCEAVISDHTHFEHNILKMYFLNNDNSIYSIQCHCRMIKPYRIQDNMCITVENQFTTHWNIVIRMQAVNSTKNSANWDSNGAKLFPWCIQECIPSMECGYRYPKNPDKSCASGFEL